MKITVLVVGRMRGSLAEAVSDMEERAARYWKLSVVEVDGGGPGGSSDPELVRAAEEERLLGRLGRDVDVVALTRAGQSMGSRAFATYVQERALHAHDMAFVIGGAFGLGAGILGRARQLTLSAMTFPHEVARLLLAEQLYRAGTILRGEPYHKGP
ncbi:MAG: 23S rRNA (pseudouridine(1915)-N(3))-methyltransferase RlmH [Gemmatimonadetes bacterium]|nr:23S rRNA (pseudouridine(1915)-N(3))-methyltransferase RlmH [Gemmatimonadota bacterium]